MQEGDEVLAHARRQLLCQAKVQQHQLQLLTDLCQALLLCIYLVSLQQHCHWVSCTDIGSAWVSCTVIGSAAQSLDQLDSILNTVNGLHYVMHLDQSLRYSRPGESTAGRCMANTARQVKQMGSSRAGQAWQIPSGWGLSSGDCMATEPMPDVQDHMSQVNK